MRASRFGVVAVAVLAIAGCSSPTAVGGAITQGTWQLTYELESSARSQLQDSLASQVALTQGRATVDDPVEIRAFRVGGDGLRLGSGQFQKDGSLLLSLNDCSSASSKKVNCNMITFSKVGPNEMSGETTIDDDGKNLYLQHVKVTAQLVAPRGQ